MSDSVVNIVVQFKGERADAFNRYKAAQFLTANSEAGTKLLSERLAQLGFLEPSSQRKPMLRAGRRKREAVQALITLLEESTG